MAGTEEIKYSGQNKTSTVVLQWKEESAKSRGRKPPKKYLVLQVGGWA
jgi:hypothetical protein